MMPQGGVAAFKLPIPLDGTQTIQEAIERIYGTGEIMMRPEGDRFTIVAPEAGWGPRKRGRGSLPSASNDQMRLRYIELRDGTAKLTVEDTQWTVLAISEIARQWFEHVGGVNYVETKLTVDGGEEPQFVFTMQRADGLSPADKVAAAEARIAELEATLARVRQARGAHPSCDKHTDDNTVSCGWKRAVLDIDSALISGEEGRVMDAT